MPRKPRIHAEGAVYHVILRGNARQEIFSDDRDRFRLYDILHKSYERFRYRIVAFCLMSTHIHLAVQVGEVPLSRIIQNVAQRYTQWFNWRHRKCGHLFQGRYKAILVDADSYLSELAAYLHLNPVRAGVVQRPEQYLWSSHRAYLGMETHPWLDCTVVLSQFSEKAGKAAQMFASFVVGKTGQGHRGEFHGEKSLDSRLFGDDRFVEDVLGRTEAVPEKRPDVATVVETVERLFGMSREQLAKYGQMRTASEVRAVTAWATRELSSGTLAELAMVLRRNPSSLTCAATRLEARLHNNPRLAKKVDVLKQELQKVQICKA
jgi:REP element-mobilizing transposase RayT